VYHYTRCNSINVIPLEHSILIKHALKMWFLFLFI